MSNWSEYLALSFHWYSSGIELRDSNLQARAAAFQAIGIATSEFHQTMDDRINLLFEQAFDEEALKTWSYIDWLAADRRVRADLRLFETALLQVDQGLLDEAAIVNLGFAAFGENWLAIPAAACLWPRLSEGPGRRRADSSRMDRRRLAGRSTGNLPCGPVGEAADLRRRDFAAVSDSTS